MSGRRMIEGLRHEWKSSGDEGAFFIRIDELGGWPVGYAFAGFEHTDERAAGFTNSHMNDGWWTVVASADDYYLWKLSPAALQRVVGAAIESVRIAHPLAGRLWIKNSRGYRACLATPTPDEVEP